MSQLQVNNITDTGGSTLLGRRNAIINGNFDVWQRGTSFTAAGTIYSADRWEFSNGSASIDVVRGGFSAGQTEVPNNPRYYIQAIKNAVSGQNQFRQKIEGVDTFAGETVTLSFYANTSSTLVLDVFQNFGTGGSSQVQTHTDAAIATVSSATSWDRMEVTFTLPSISGKTVNNADSYVLIRIKESEATTNHVSITQVQLEAGSVATPFERRSYGEELALCQRYYETNGSTQNEEASLSVSSSVTNVKPNFQVTKRTIPTITYSNAFRGGVPFTPAQAIRPSEYHLGMIQNTSGSSYAPNISISYDWTADAEL